MRVSFLFLLATLIAKTAITAQSLVSVIPSNRNVVLEEFTGVRCGYCPEGHAIGASIYEKNPSRTVLISIHSGPFADPQSGYPDFTTQFGAAIDNNAQVSGYPAATVNRRKYNDAAALSMGRDKWVAASDAIRALPSPVNIGIKSEFDPATRTLTVLVETYYTDNSPAPENYLNVALLENKVIGYQSDYANGNRNDYSHNHMLRWMLAGQWGEKIVKTTKGSLNSNTYSYTVPAAFAIENCEIAAFVSENEKSEIYTGDFVAANGGTTQPIVSLASDMLPYAAIETGKTKIFEMKTENLDDIAQEMRISLETNAPSDWTAQGNAGNGMTINFSAQKPAEFTIDAKSAYNANLSITPGPTAAVAKFTITFESVSTPNARKMQIVYYVISGVKDLVVSHEDAVKFDAKYLAAMQTTGKTGIAATTQDIYVQLSKNSLTNGVKNLYFNISWAFPGVTDDLVAEIAKAMDNGMNALFAGQDLGWDIASLDSNSHGTPAQRDFYSKYLKAKFIADGSKDNSSVSAVNSDAVFGETPSFAVADVYGTGANLYPELIEPLDGARPIFIYNNDASKIGGVRAETPQYKMAYLGFGLEQINLPGTAGKIMKAASDWFDGMINAVEFDASLLAATASPNPTRGMITLYAPKGGQFATIINSAGTIIATQAANEATAINASAFASGIYRCIFTDRVGARLGDVSFAVEK